MAALRHRAGPAVVRGNNVHPLRSEDAGNGDAGREAGREDDSQASTVVGRLEAILASFEGCDHALALTEISHRVGLPKSTVHRLANQLCAVGWLERNSGGYRVGLKLLELGSVALQRTGLREVAFKHLHSLAQRTGLAVHLGILDHGEVVYLDRVATTRVSLPTRVGGRQPAYCTALGKAMLAFEDPASQAAALTDMTRRTEFTITEPRVMRAALDSARQTGSAYDREEAYRGHRVHRLAHSQRRTGDRRGVRDRARREDAGALAGPRGAEHCPGGPVGRGSAAAEAAAQRALRRGPLRASSSLTALPAASAAKGRPRSR